MKVCIKYKVWKNLVAMAILYSIVIFPMDGEASIYKKNIQISSLKRPPHIVFLISEDPLNYEAHKTIPLFAEMLNREFDFQVTVLLGEGKHGSFRFEGLDILSEADLLVVFCRRVALPHNQLEIIKQYLKNGKPLVGLRTANHAFSVRAEVADGFEGWWGFVPDILGCENKGYEPEKLGTEVKVVSESVDHPILKDIEVSKWYSKGQVYKVAPLIDNNAVVLLTGQAKNKSKLQPIAWTRQTAHKSHIFYTSLGYPDDFEYAPFRNLLINGIHWAMKLDPERI